MKVLIEIEVGNDAVQTGFDVAELLQQAADRVDARIGANPVADYPRDFGNLHDLNGNAVGLWRVAEND